MRLLPGGKFGAGSLRFNAGRVCLRGSLRGSFFFSVVCVTTKSGEAPREVVSDKGAAAGSSNAAAADPVAKFRW